MKGIAELVVVAIALVIILVGAWGISGWDMPSAVNGSVPTTQEESSFGCRHANPAPRVMCSQ